MKKSRTPWLIDLYPPTMMAVNEVFPPPFAELAGFSLGDKINVLMTVGAGRIVSKGLAKKFATMKKLMKEDR